MGKLLQRLRHAATVAHRGHHSGGVVDLAEAFDGFAVHLEGIVEEAMFVVHRAKIVFELAFEAEVFGGWFAALHQREGLQETLGGLFREALLAQFGTFFI